MAQARVILAHAYAIQTQQNLVAHVHAILDLRQVAQHVLQRDVPTILIVVREHVIPAHARAIPMQQNQQMANVTV